MLEKISRISYLTNVFTFSYYRINVLKDNKQQGKLASCQPNFDLKRVANTFMPSFISLKKTHVNHLIILY